MRNAPRHPERAQRVEGSAPRQFGGPSHPDNRVTRPGVYSPTWKGIPIARIPPSPHLAMDAEFIALQSALAGEYSLDREIGRGGMGIVYLAREVRLARPVAIKVLPPALAERPELREAFLREAQTAAALTHPNIVPVYAV